MDEPSELERGKVLPIVKSFQPGVAGHPWLRTTMLDQSAPTLVAPTAQVAEGIRREETNVLLVLAAALGIQEPGQALNYMRDHLYQ